jgi:hypothetical protein
LPRRAGEEVVFCLGVRAKGWRIRYEPRAVVGHQIPRSRATWPSMLRRVYAAGRESVYGPQRLEPLPRRLTAPDRLFLATIAPVFFAGRMAEQARDRGQPSLSSQARA